MTDTMTAPRAEISLRRLGTSFASELSGVDLARDASAELFEAIEDALCENGVLVLRDQRIDDAQQQSLVEHFGPPVVPVLDAIRRSGDRNPHFFDVATVDEEGRPLEAGSARALYFLANKLWHTDGSQAQPPVRVSILSAQVLPGDPPPTEYADMRAAWDALPAARQEEIDGLEVVHDILFSRAKIAPLAEGFAEDSRKKRPPVTHPLVRVHPRTGRKSLYLASHASHIVGRPIEEGCALIEELTAFATQPRFVYAHRWQPFDLVLWDDSWTMHRATDYEGDEPRILRWGGALERQPV